MGLVGMRSRFRALAKKVGQVISVLVCVLYLQAPAAASSEPRIHAMFVGIADYKHGEKREEGGPRPVFEDLAGAPADIAAITSAFESRITLAQSKVLLDEQASREGIISTFNTLATDAEPGDFILFYYSGHGAQVYDLSGQQLSGYSSTIVPWDARDPGLPMSAAGDILDNELRILIDSARARGINVVTIFDSCNSGTATRDPTFDSTMIRNRGAPALRVENPIEPNVKTVTAMARSASAPVAQGYSVHLAAAPDGAEALERYVDGRWRGDFTEALTNALDELSANATYRDLLDAVRFNLRKWLRSDGNGRVMLDIRGEGDLDQQFLGAWDPIRLLDGSRDEDGSWSLQAGTLAGVTVGSRFAGYASGGDARSDNKQPLAEAVVSATYPSYSDLQVDIASSASAVPGKLVWRETARGAGQADLLKVALPATGAQLPEPTISTLRGLQFVELVEKAPDLLLRRRADGLLEVARWEDDTTITAFDVSDTGQLKDVLTQISRYRQVLGLIGTGNKIDIDFRISSTDCYGGNPVPEIQYEDGEPKFIVGDPERSQFYFTLSHRGAGSLYPHLINLTANYGIALVGTTGQNAEEDKHPPGTCWNYGPASISGDGREHMLLVIADRPLPGLYNLNAADLIARNITDPLDRMLQNAARGTRSAAASAPGGIWSVRAISYVIEGEN